MFEGLATSHGPFIVWWRAQIQAVLGIGLGQPLPGPPNDQLYDWSAA